MTREWTYNATGYGEYDVIIVDSRKEMLERIIDEGDTPPDTAMGYIGPEKDVPFILFNVEDFLDRGDSILWHECGHLAFMMLRRVKYEWESEEPFLELQSGLVESAEKCMYESLLEYSDEQEL